MRQIFQAVAIGLALGPGVAGACTYMEPFAVESLATADIILVGEVRAYQVLNVAPGAALVTVRVREVLKGEAEAEMVLVWNSGMASGPHEGATIGRVLIGAALAGRAPSNMVEDARPDLPMILQPYCGVASIQPATPALVAKAKAMVAP
jgi:hypothetical protein